MLYDATIYRAVMVGLYRIVRFIVKKGSDHGVLLLVACLWLDQQQACDELSLVEARCQSSDT